MPKLNKLTISTAHEVVTQLDKTRISLFAATQQLNRYYRKDDRLVKRAQSFYDLFEDFKKDCESKLKAKLDQSKR